MSQRCTVCHHEQRADIDRALVRGHASNRSIAAQHALSEASVRRHKDAHLPDLLLLARRDDEATRELDIAVLVRSLVADAHRIREKAERAGDYRAALQGVRELVRLVELAVVTGQVPRPEAEQGRHVTVIWDMGDELPPSQQQPAASTHPPQVAAESVAVPNTMPRAGQGLPPRVRRRRFYG
jgi:hypothetical protein